MWTARSRSGRRGSSRGNRESWNCRACSSSPLLLEQPRLVLMELRRHAVERVAQAADLVARAHRDPRLEVAPAEALDPLHEAGEVARDAPREREDAGEA